MDHGNTIGDALTAIAIFGSGFSFWAYCLRLKYQQKALEIKAMRGESLGEHKDAEIARLREEVARLRETTTQYDISIQHALEETQYRLAALETKTRAIAVPESETPTVQRNGLGG